ncbi:hypothetical protein T12_14830 [Trichinella patagoniensis]|uniref:Uncharacterized protein n=1 Tax=Trichinella patagoniensis TaxID=990121 RepID=A0A0V1A2R0_9BILA|nr:hypothetical protein T12_14830 [Trichinella patagoniensis]
MRNFFLTSVMKHTRVSDAHMHIHRRHTYAFKLSMFESVVSFRFAIYSMVKFLRSFTIVVSRFQVIYFNYKIRIFPFFSSKNLSVSPPLLQLYYYQLYHKVNK